MTGKGVPFPVSKLIFMFVKQTSLPLSKRIKSKARDSLTFAKWFVIPLANCYHVYETKMKLQRRISMSGGISRILPPLDNKSAMDLGSRLLSEFIIMLLASLVAFNEYVKHKNRENEGDAEFSQYVRHTRETLSRLRHVILESDRDLRELESAFNQMQIKLESL